MGDTYVSGASQGLRCAAAAALAAFGGMGTGACSSSPAAQASREHADEAGAAGSGSGGSSGFATDAQSAGASSGASSGAVSSGAGTSGASSSGAQSEGGAPVVCAANCTGKTCGTDGCSGTCGGCPPSQLCGPAQTCVTPADTTAVVVDANSQTTPISSAIYGVAFNSDDSMRVAGLNRWGGDATSSYNWKVDVSNAGADWNCANYVGRFTSPTPDPSLHTSSDQFVHYNISQQADTLMTIPITGWVASVATPNSGSLDCAGGTAISSCCTTLGTSEAELVDKGSSVLDTSFMGDWVTHLVQTFGPASGGGVRYYQLDNEPDNWQALRKDIYPALYPPGTWCEPFYSTNTNIGTSLNQDFINRTMAYSKAIKAADPTATVLFMSTENAQDLVALPNVECGNPPGPYTVVGSLTKAILQLAAADEASSHVRLLDCIDMHYPFPSMGLGETKALWDSTSSSVVPYAQGWINAMYPGTGICVSEYNVPNDGGNGQNPGASTGAEEADILGMFGRLGYRVAAYWTTLVSGSTHLPVYNAMAMYRDYDGNSGRFGAVSIGAASPYAGVNAYAASDSPTTPTKVWVMLVNISGANQSGISVALQNFTAVGSAEVYRMTGGAAPASDTALAVTGGRITGLSLPSNSAALLVLSN